MLPWPNRTPLKYMRMLQKSFLQLLVAPLLCLPQKYAAQGLSLITCQAIRKCYFCAQYPFVSQLSLCSFCFVVPGTSFVGRLFRHALEESRPKSVLVHSLSVCISLLDPKRLASASYQAFRSNLSHGTLVTASPETVDGMLESLGECYLISSTNLMLLVLYLSCTCHPDTFCHMHSPYHVHHVMHLATDMFNETLIPVYLYSHLR